MIEAFTSPGTMIESPNALSGETGAAEAPVKKPDSDGGNSAGLESSKPVQFRLFGSSLKQYNIINILVTKW